MKYKILIILFFIIISCKYDNKEDSRQIQIVIDSTGLKIEPIKKQTKNLKLTTFLENPIELQAYKKLKKMRFTTSVTNGTDYHLHPQINDSILYIYYYPNNEIVSTNKIDEIVVFKYAENKHRYEDETEILIELNVFNKDSDLGKANLVGLTKTELETEFGSDYLTLDERIVYSNKNKILMIEFDNSKVKSYKYLKLNTENININLIQKIALQHP